MIRRIARFLRSLFWLPLLRGPFRGPDDLATTAFSLGQLSLLHALSERGVVPEISVLRDVSEVVEEIAEGRLTLCDSAPSMLRTASLSDEDSQKFADAINILVFKHRSVAKRVMREGTITQYKRIPEPPQRQA